MWASRCAARRARWAARVATDAAKGARRRKARRPSKRVRRARQPQRRLRRVFRPPLSTPRRWCRTREHPGEQKPPSQLPQRRDLLGASVRSAAASHVSKRSFTALPFNPPPCSANGAKATQLEVPWRRGCGRSRRSPSPRWSSRGAHVVGVDERVHDPAIVGAVVGAPRVAAGGGVGEGGGARLVQLRLGGHREALRHAIEVVGLRPAFHGLGGVAVHLAGDADHVVVVVAAGDDVVARRPLGRPCPRRASRVGPP